MVRVMAVVAAEDLIATEPPVDTGARAQRFQETIEGEGPTRYGCSRTATGWWAMRMCTRPAPASSRSG
jgi:hypothetical protein